MAKKPRLKYRNIKREFIDHGIYSEVRISTDPNAPGEFVQAPLVPSVTIKPGWVDKFMEQIGAEIEKALMSDNETVVLEAHKAADLFKLVLHLIPDLPSGKFAVASAIQLGIVVERMHVATIQWQNLKYKNSANGSRKINAWQKAKAEARSKDWPAMVAAEIEAQVANGDKPGYHAACEAVATELGVNGRTIRKHVENIWTPRDCKKSR